MGPAFPRGPVSSGRFRAVEVGCSEDFPQDVHVALGAAAVELDRFGRQSAQSFAFLGIVEEASNHGRQFASLNLHAAAGFGEESQDLGLFVHMGTVEHRYAVDGGHASTGSSSKYRCRSLAKSLALS